MKKSTITKIAIFGSYGGNSIGDTAILLGLLSSLDRIYDGNVSVNVLANESIALNTELERLEIRLRPTVTTISNREKTYPKKLIYIAKVLINRITYIFPFKKKAVRSALSGVDHLIVGGGNLVMDYYDKWPVELRFVLAVASKLGIKYSFIGVGAGPIATRKGSEILRHCLLGAERILFRDERSGSLVSKHINVHKWRVMPDLAYALANLPTNPAKERQRKLLVNVAGYYDRYWPIQDLEKNSKYIFHLAQIANRICTERNIDQMEIFTTNLIDIESTSRFVDEFKRLRADVNVVFKPNSAQGVSDLLTIAGNAEIILSTRLHAAIIAALGGCEVLAVSYQDKVRDVLSCLGKKAAVVGINEVLNSPEVPFTPIEDQGQTRNVRSSLSSTIDLALKSSFEN